MTVLPDATATLAIRRASPSAVLVFPAVTALRPKNAASYATLGARMIVLSGRKPARPTRPESAGR